MESFYDKFMAKVKPLNEEVAQPSAPVNSNPAPVNATAQKQADADATHGTKLTVDADSYFSIKNTDGSIVKFQKGSESGNTLTIRVIGGVEGQLFSTLANYINGLANSTSKVATTDK